MTNPTPLSPAAQAVLDAVMEICPAPADEIAAAALRAAADQVVPKRKMPVHACLASETAWSARGYVRKDLLAIVAELEGCAVTVQLTPRQHLLNEISDRLCDALQSDLEHGVRCLNKRAAESFRRNYPALNDVIRWINDIYFEEMPDD